MAAAPLAGNVALSQENTFWKKENVALQPNAAKRTMIFPPSETTHFFLKGKLCPYHSYALTSVPPIPKCKWQFGFITVMMIMKTIWEWRCLASSSCNSWSYLFPGDMEMEKGRRLTCVGLAVLHTHWLSQNLSEYWCSIVQRLRKKSRLREVNLTQIVAKDQNYDLNSVIFDSKSYQIYTLQ